MNWCERRFIAGILTPCVLAVLLAWAPSHAGARAFPKTVNGLFIQGAPLVYAQQERFWAGLAGLGADTVILELPTDDRGLPDLRTLPNTVFLVHQAGMRIFIVMPTRNMPALIKERPEWEDRAYDLSAGSYRRSGKLDLFNDQAVAHLAGLAKKIAAYSVDGILLNEDFYYAPQEGMGRALAASAEKKLGFPVEARSLFLRIDRSGSEPVIAEFGTGFTAWAKFKQDRLVETFRTIREAARTMQPGIKVGVPVPALVPVATPSGLLTRYSFDINAYRKSDADYYWTMIGRRGTGKQNALSYRESMQLASREAKAAVSTVNDNERMIVVLQAVTVANKALPSFEIEEATSLVRRVGRTGLVYVVAPGAVPSEKLMKKVFGAVE